MSDAVAQRADAERVHSLYRQGPIASLVALVVGGILLAAMWEAVPRGWLWTWFALVAANQAVRLALWRAFHREKPAGERVSVWARRYAIGMGVGGALFGSIAFFMPIATPLGQAVLMVMVSGMAAGSVTANAAYRPAMLAYLVAILTPMTLLLTWMAFSHATLEHGLLAFSYWFYALVLFAFGRNQSRLLDELREKTAIAEQASLAKSQFFAAASHDLRQPLQALGLYAASLRESRRGTEDARRVDQILSSVDSLESLFDELLDISKLDAGYVHPAPAHFPARALFDRLAATWAPVARHNGLGLAFDDAGAVLQTDPVLLERVVGNLVSNALRYTPAGEVRVRCRAQGARVALDVSDTGIGIPAVEHERVFEEFYQLGNPERDRRKGLGLGLATVKRIAALLECPLALDSAPGRGSKFTLLVPAGDPAQLAAAPAPHAAAPLDMLRGRAVAVLDDDGAVREGLAELLGVWHCKVYAASSTAELLALLESSGARPEVVLADFRLRADDSGTTAIAAVRERYGNALPAVLISGDTTPEIFRAAQELGLPVLSKPVRAAALRAVLQRLLAAPSAHRGADAVHREKDLA